MKGALVADLVAGIPPIAAASAPPVRLIAAPGRLDTLLHRTDFS